MCEAMRALRACQICEFHAKREIRGLRAKRANLTKASPREALARPGQATNSYLKVTISYFYYLLLLLSNY